MNTECKCSHGYLAHFAVISGERLHCLASGDLYIDTGTRKGHFCPCATFEKKL